ncbi:hypothetical protein HDU98_004062 [Podochytrium sp. JEL0797]|nr:hypothetical protein HDU98_004062 [Podochytrium sp. JEL0797]
MASTRSALLHALYLTLHRKDTPHALSKTYSSALAALDEDSLEEQEDTSSLRIALLSLCTRNASSLSPQAAAEMRALLHQIETRRRALVAAAKNTSSNTTHLVAAKNTPSQTTLAPSQRLAASRLASLTDKSAHRLKLRFDTTAKHLAMWMLAIHVSSNNFSTANAHAMLNSLLQTKTRDPSILPIQQNEDLIKSKQTAVEWIMEAGKRVDPNAPLLSIDQFAKDVPWVNVGESIKQYVYNEFDFTSDLKACCEVLNQSTATTSLVDASVRPKVNAGWNTRVSYASVPMKRPAEQKEEEVEEEEEEFRALRFSPRRERRQQTTAAAHTISSKVILKKQRVVV